MTVRENTESICPQCNRFISTAGKCPYCGAKIPKPLNVRVLRIAAVTVSIFGVLCMWYFSQKMPVKRITVGQIVPANNFAYGKISGICTRAAQTDDNFFATRMFDGTGEIDVKAYGTQADDICEKKKIPLVGDSIVVCGILRVRDGKAYMLINYEKNFTVGPCVPESTKLCDIDSSMMFKAVHTLGQIKTFKYGENYAKITISSSECNAEIDVPIFANSISDSQVPSFNENEIIAVTGVVSRFRGKLQIMPRSFQDIIIVSQTSDSENAFISKQTQIYPIADIPKIPLGQRVCIEGEIGSLRQINGGTLVELADKSGKTTTPLWKDVLEKNNAFDKMTVGDRVKICGKIGEYRGKKQVVVKMHTDVSFLQRAQPIEKDRLNVELAHIGEMHVGKYVSIAVKITNIKEVKGGKIVTVRQNDEYISCPFWTRSVGAEVISELVVGKDVVIFGVVERYKNSLQVVPQKANDVKFENRR